MVGSALLVRKAWASPAKPRTDEQRVWPLHRPARTCTDRLWPKSGVRSTAVIALSRCAGAGRYDCRVTPRGCRLGRRPWAEKPLGEGVRELAGRVMPDHHALECLEILLMKFVQIFHIEAVAVLAEMGAATQFFDELYCGRIVCLESVGVVADNIDPSGTAFSTGAYDVAA